MKRKCSNCHIEVELKDEKYKFYRPDIVFCSKKCEDEFMDRDSQRRKELGWKPLKEV